MAVVTCTGDRMAVVSGTGDRMVFVTDTGDKMSLVSGTGDRMAVVTDTGDRLVVVSGTGDRMVVVKGTGDRMAVVKGTGDRMAMVKGTGDRMVVVTGTGDTMAVVSDTGDSLVVVSGTGDRMAVVKGTGDRMAVVKGTGDRMAMVKGTGDKMAVVSGTGDRVDLWDLTLLSTTFGEIPGMSQPWTPEFLHWSALETFYNKEGFSPIGSSLDWLRGVQTVVCINLIGGHQTKVPASSPCPMQIRDSSLNMTFIHSPRLPFVVNGHVLLGICAIFDRPPTEDAQWSSLDPGGQFWGVILCTYPVTGPLDSCGLLLCDALPSCLPVLPCLQDLRSSEDELSPPAAFSSAGEHEVDKKLSSLMQNSSIVVPAMDDLRHLGLLTNEQYELVKNKGTPQEQMKELYRQVKGWSHTAKTTVYQCLQKYNPLVMMNVETSLQSVKIQPEHCPSHEASTADSMHSVQRIWDDRPNVDHKPAAHTLAEIRTRLQNEQTEENHRIISILEKLTSQTDELHQKVHHLQEHEAAEKAKSETITKRIGVMFSDSRRQMDSLENRVMSEISRQREQVSLSVSYLIHRLWVKKEELRREIHHIEKMCAVADPQTILQDLEYTACIDSEVERRLSAVRGMDMGLITATLHFGLSNIITNIKRGKIANILLDIKTAENHVCISKDLKTAAWSQRDLQRPDIGDRFIQSQVLSCEGLTTGQWYWEVETSEVGAWRVGMSYPSVARKEEQGCVGNNEKSWCLCRWIGSYEYAVLHNGNITEIKDKVSSQRFGIYLDYEAGQLSFYELRDPIRYLHTFSATFTEPLHAAIYVWNRGCDRDCWVRIRS
ncbi:uncharacterized protein LOC142209955 [Leptodactylus fuscus]|uniref:uncharacterized protein LOC142209955 n=1 Tax=Leptodactylus fuscus TaxID=238119 RepID=UPI003F4E6B36